MFSTSSAPPTPILYENNVDLSPLLDLELPSDMGQVTADILDMKRLRLLPGIKFESQGPMALGLLRYSYQMTDLEGEESLFSVDIALMNSPNDAMFSGQSLCVQPIYQTNFPTQDTQNNYCITHLQQGRSGPDVIWGHVAYDYYMGSVSVQKGNLVININEYTHTTDRVLMNEAIKELANSIISPITYPNEVDLSPLFNLKIPNDMGQVATETVDFENLNLLPDLNMLVPGYKIEERFNFNYQISDANFGTVAFDVYIFLEDSIKSAKWRTRKMCTRPIYLSNIDSEDEEVYCITHLVQTQSESNGTDEIYKGNIAVQKGNLVISIEEQTNTLDRTLMNEAIKQISEIIVIPSEK